MQGPISKSTAVFERQFSIPAPHPAAWVTDRAAGARLLPTIAGFLSHSLAAARLGSISTARRTWAIAKRPLACHSVTLAAPRSAKICHRPRSEGTPSS
jgi:hypothetical protein